MNKSEKRMEAERSRFKNGAFFVKFEDELNWIGRIPSAMLGDARLHFDERKFEGIDVHIKMPKGFPFEAPDVRVLQPKLVSPIVFDGALCLEVLSPFGWSPGMSIDMLMHHIIDQLLVQYLRVDSGSYTEIQAKNGRRWIDRVHKKGF